MFGVRLVARTVRMSPGDDGDPRPAMNVSNALSLGASLESSFTSGVVTS